MEKNQWNSSGRIRLGRGNRTPESRSDQGKRSPGSRPGREKRSPESRPGQGNRTLESRSGKEERTPESHSRNNRNKWNIEYRAAAAWLLGIAVLCLLAGIISPYSPREMSAAALAQAPSAAHLFGTDALGRDLFTMVLYGGRASLVIGILASGIAAVMALIYGTLSGMANATADNLMMRFLDLLISIPGILLVIFLQGIWGRASYLSLAVIIGMTSWMNIARVVRSEVRRIRESEYILAARLMGGSFGYVLRRHIAPNCLSAIVYMVVSNVGTAMVTESTLSFIGLGLPPEEVSWGSLLSMSQDALFTDHWWILVIPGTILVITLICIAELGEAARRRNIRGHSNL